MVREIFVYFFSLVFLEYANIFHLTFLSLNMTIFLIGCIVSQQIQEAQHRSKKTKFKTLEQITDSFEYDKDDGQALEQPMLQVPAVDFGSYGDFTFAAGIWVPTVQADTALHNIYGDTMGQIL
jgi:hypothetical protein